MTELVSVWSLDGTEHRMTVANASDMVRHNKWTRHPIGASDTATGDINMEIPEAFRRGRATPEALLAVTDREGKTHMLTAANAHDTVRHLGWTTSGIVAKQPAAPAAVEEEDAIDTGADLSTGSTETEKPADESEPPKEEEQTVDFSTMSRDDLVAFAKTKFDMDFGPEVEQGAILDAILAEIE